MQFFEPFSRPFPDVAFPSLLGSKERQSDKTVLEKLDFPAAVFSAPHFSDMLERKPVFLTTAAKALGANEDMTGAELIPCFS
jgi:hypothetical protein